MNRTSPLPDSDPAETRAPAQARAPQPVGGLVQRSSLDRAIDAAREALSGVQNERGYWLFELEADCTISAEYILMLHFLGEIDRPLETKIAAYLRARQAQHGGWPLYQGGELDISCTVKAYFALKLAGDSAQAPHMLRARAALLERGGAARANVFTRITLALFGQVPWRAVPYIPVEIMLLPRWFPFHLDKVSYWSRTVMVPLLILCTRRPRAKNPRNVDITELFTTPPEQERHYFRTRSGRSVLLARAFLVLDRCARRIDPLIPGAMRRRATRRAEAWILERLNGEDGLGAIFPAMVNAVEALTVLGYPSEDPRLVAAKRALHKLLVIGAESAYCQPCVSPIWDTALATLALQDEGSPAATAASRSCVAVAAGATAPRAAAAIGKSIARRFPAAAGRSSSRTASTPISTTPRRSSGPCVGRAMPTRYSQPVDRALDWLVGMQSRNGGFGSFDVDNVHYRLNHIPFADHGALLDPPTSDVTARVVTALATVGRPQDEQPLERAVAFLRQEQEADGSWFGRWGTNYIYGTWSVLTALAQARVRSSDEAVGRAVRWLCARQNSDGGWGESNDSYAQAPAERRPAASTSFQSAWALLGLIAAGQVHSDVVGHGIDYLLRTQNAHGLWNDPGFTAPGFPRVFYLKYHGYSAYFPLWALAAYRSLARSGGTH